MTYDAFESLALEQMDSVHRMALHLTRQEDLAEDVVQETYLRAFKAASSFEDRGDGIRPWLWRICRNVFYTMINKQRRELTGQDELFHQCVANEPTGGWDFRTLDWEQVDERLKQAIDALDVQYREVLLLWAVDGLKYREVADVLDIPIGTVMSRLYRARATLRNQLENMHVGNKLTFTVGAVAA